MPNSNVSSSAAAATDNPQPVLTPVTSPNLILLLATLPAGKDAGVAAIRISRVNGDFQLEELDSSGNSMIGIVLQMIVDASTQKVTAIAVKPLGSPLPPLWQSTPTLPLPLPEYMAFLLITDELYQFQASLSANANLREPCTHLPESDKTESSALLGLKFVLSCRQALNTVGLNPIEDSVCIAEANQVLSELGCRQPYPPDVPRINL